MNMFKGVCVMHKSAIGSVAIVAPSKLPSSMVTMVIMVPNNKIHCLMTLYLSSFDTMVTMVDGNLDNKIMVTMALFFFIRGAT